MKNNFNHIKIFCLFGLYSLVGAEDFLPFPSGDLANSNNVIVSGAISDINSLNANANININKNSSIALLPNQNAKDILIKSPFDINNTFTTDSRGGVNNKLYFSKQILVNADYIDYGSKFVGEGGKFLNSGWLVSMDNNPAIQINGGKVTLYNSHLESGQMTPGEYDTNGYIAKASPTIELKKGSLDIVGGTIIGFPQGSSYAKAIDVIADGKDIANLTIIGSNLIVDKSSASINTNRSITINDTLWNTKWSDMANAPAKQGSHLVGGVNASVQVGALIADPKFTFYGVLKNGFSVFDAKSSSSLITNYKDPMILNHTPFDSFIQGTSYIDGIVDIDTAYLLGNIKFNQQSEKNGRLLSFKNVFITGMIEGSYSSNLTNIKYTSNFVFDNVLSGGLVVNNYGDIISTNSYFSKNIKAIKNGASVIKDNGSIFIDGASANNLDFTNSELKGGNYGVTDGLATSKAVKIILNNVKSYDNTKIFTNELNLTNSIVNSSLDTNLILSTNSYINTKLKNNLNSVTLNGGSIMGGFKTQNLNANNVVFFLGGTKLTYDGMIFSSNSTLGSNNILGILGVVSKDGNGKLITSAIDSNLPLAILRGGNDFFKQAKFYYGITEFAPANASLIYEKVKDKNGNEYLAYVLVKDSDSGKSISEIILDNGLSFSVENAINGNLASGSLVNESIYKELLSKNPSSNALFSRDDVGNLANVVLPPNSSEPIIPPSSDSNDNNESGDNNESNDSDENNNNPNSDKPITPPSSNNQDSNNSDNKNDSFIDTKPLNENKLSIKEELELMAVGQNEVALNEARVMVNQFYYSHIFEYNNINKRMGELRRLNGEDGGIWGRGYFAKANVYDTELFSSAMQIGVDKINNTKLGFLYTGILLNTGKTKSDTNSKIDNYGGGFYASFIGCSGFFADFTLKLNHYKSYFKNNTFLGELKGNITGYIASFEMGKRFGSDFYIEPSVELIASYTPKTDINNQNINIQSEENLMKVVKTSLNSGLRFDDFDLRFGVGGVFDLSKPSDFVANDGFGYYVFGRDKDRRGFLTFGLNTNFGKNTMFSIELEKGFGGVMKLKYDTNATIRYEF